MKNLVTLIKLQKTLVDEQQALLAKLQSQLQDIENKIIQHEIMMAREQVAAQKSTEAKLTYGAFLKTAIHKTRDLENQKQVAAQAVEIARFKLSELFEEQKRYEIAEDMHKHAELKEEKRRETKELDEIGSIGYVRKSKKSEQGT